MTQAFNLSQFANKVNTSGQADLTTAVTGTLPVVNGGTGNTTYTNGQLLIGNTTGNTLTKATLTQGTGISITNGSGSITIANTAQGGFSQMQVFASPGTFTTPGSTTQIKVTVIGGGGNGGTGTASSGGGGGGAAIYVGPVSASTPYPVTVGSAGGTSSFSTLASATGGSNGSGNPSTTAATYPGGAGGAGTAGTLQIKGSPGGSGYAPGGVPAGPAIKAPGGSSILGGGGLGLSNGAPGGAYGGGGSGGVPTGGTGASGVVIVEY